MTTGHSSVEQPSSTARHAAVAAAALFLVNGATFSNWLPRIPEIRDQLGIGNAGLGVTLLGGGLGGIVGALAVGRLSERIGSSRLLTIAAVTLSLGMPLIAFAPHAAVLMVLLTVLGAFDVFNDVAMNAQGVLAQEQLGRQIMNRLHGMWSLGFTGGALVGSLARATDVPIEVHLLAVGAALLATTLVMRRWFIPIDPPHAPADASALAGASGASEASGTARSARWGPRGPMIAMSLAAIGAIALEVTPADWSAVMLTDVFDTARYGGLGTVACAGAMLVGRLSGDHVLERIGDHRMMTGSMWLIAVGLLVTVTAPVTAVALVGLVIWGLGLAVIFPQLYATAARLPGTSAGAGLGWMLLGQRFGSMLTAVSIGAISQWYDLRVAFAVVGGGALVLMVVSLRRGSRAARTAVPGDAPSDAATSRPT